MKPYLDLEDLDEDKKRRGSRRVNRRAKQSSGQIRTTLSDLVENGGGQFAKVSEEGSNSMPDVHLNSSGAFANLGISGFVASGASEELCKLTHIASRKKYFDPHLSEEVVKEGLEKGYVFRGAFRVNAYNRLEAYCTVDGLPIDILISGVTAQNRAVEGDIVAVMLDPVSMWTKLKGNAAHTTKSSLLDETDAFQGEGENVDTADKNPHFSDSDNPDWNRLFPVENGNSTLESISANKADQIIMENKAENPCGVVNSCNSSFPDNKGECSSEKDEGSAALERWCAIINSFPSKRPTGKVVAIIEKSHRRDAIVGFVSICEIRAIFRCHEKQVYGKLPNYSVTNHVILRPNDPRFSDMIVSVVDLPGSVIERVARCDPTVEMDLVAARIDNWAEESLLPQAHISIILGRGGELKTQIAAIFFENKICDSGFSPESISCLPDIPWRIPEVEFESRRDLRKLCTFTIDPSSAVDLDDALSVERISNDVFRVGVHIADVSYFILPGSALDEEARTRSTSVYVSQYKLPMLPPVLSEELGSLNPGVDRLAFSIIWDISDSEGIINQWIGHSVISSCCKLSYEHAQSIIDGTLVPGSKLDAEVLRKDVMDSVLILHKLSKRLKENRFKDGALRLDSAKLVILFEECGIPYDLTLFEGKESNSLVEEFMLLANRTVAEILSKTFHECSLLRRHPEPNLRKLKEFKAFCNKHGFELDTSSSAKLQISLSKLKEKLRDDPVLFNILVSYASKSMQLATYFCTGDLKDREDEWGHYALATPFYTHFTSPLRRYPDIVVHRTLCAVLEAEKQFLRLRRMLTGESYIGRCFTGINFNAEAVVCLEGMEALETAALKYKLPGKEALSEIAAYCNSRKLASKHAEESGKKVYLWAMLRNKENLVAEARVMGLGPRFMSVYVDKIAMERRIYFTEVEGLAVEWLEYTTTLVLDLVKGKRAQKKAMPNSLRPLHDVALLINPSDICTSLEASHTTMLALSCTAANSNILPATFPLALGLLSTVPIVLHAVGGDDGPVDIGVRLYMSSYFQ